MSLPFYLLVVSSKPNIYPGRSKCLNLTIWQGSDHPNGKKCFPWSPPKEATGGKNTSLDDLWGMCVYQELCQVLRHNDNQSDPQTQELIVYLETSRKDSWKRWHQEKPAKSKGNLVAFLHLEHVVSKVIAVEEKSYFLLEVLDSLEFCEIPCSWFLLYHVGQFSFVSFAGHLSLFNLNL